MMNKQQSQNPNDELVKYLLKIPNFFDDKFCKQTVLQLKNTEFQQHTFYNPKTEQTKPRSEKELYVSWNNIDNKKPMMNKLHSGITSYIEHFNFPWFSQWSGYTNIRFNRYSKGQEMGAHCDHIHSMFDGERKGIPIISLLGALNDDYEGGEFIMFDDYEVKLNTGDLILWPSNFLYRHEVKPVTSGERYTYVSWVW